MPPKSLQMGFEMTQVKAVVYQKMKSNDPSDRDFDPTDIELHYWVVEAKTSEEAIKILERR